MPKADERPAGDKHNATPEFIEEDVSESPVGECWEFWLAQPTATAESLQLGTSVTGIPSGTTVLISAQGLGVVGEAPSDKASEILEALSTYPVTASPSGEIVEGEGPNSKVIVCLPVP